MKFILKLKKLQMKQVLSKATLVVCHFKTKGKKLKIRDILDDTQRHRLVSLDEGFYVFSTIQIHQHT